MEAGTLVGSNVRLVRMLGEGGMGSVWLGEHLTLKTQVAVKLMSEALVRNVDARARFSAEAAAAAQVKSRHIVQMLDHGVTNGRPFIVMELLAGESLEQRLERAPKLSVNETATIVRQTCKALHKAHELGIVHRDIKPENLFLTEDDGETVLKVLDFGIARSGSDLETTSRTQTGSMIGTPLYMSPEQVKSARGIDARADLWSLGVVAYRTITGKFPFDGETAGAVFIAVDHGNFTAPSEIDPSLAMLDAWFSRALAVDREKRFASARDMSDSLVAALSGEATSIGSIAPLTRSASSSFASLPASSRRGARSSRHRAKLVVFVGAAAAIVGFGTVALVRVATRSDAPVVGITQPAPPPPTSAPLIPSSPATLTIPSPEPAPAPDPAPDPKPAPTPHALQAPIPIVPASALPVARPTADPAPVRKKKDRGF